MDNDLSPEYRVTMMLNEAEEKTDMARAALHAIARLRDESGGLDSSLPFLGARLAAAFRALDDAYTWIHTTWLDAHASTPELNPPDEWDEGENEP